MRIVFVAGHPENGIVKRFCHDLSSQDVIFELT